MQYFKEKHILTVAGGLVDESNVNSYALRETFKSHPLGIPLILVAFGFIIAISILCYYHLKITLEYATTHEDLK